MSDFATNMGIDPAVKKEIDSVVERIERESAERSETPGTREYSLKHGYLKTLRPLDVVAIHAPLELFPAVWWDDSKSAPVGETDDLLNLTLDTMWWELEPPRSKTANTFVEDSRWYMNFEDQLRPAVMRDGKLEFEEPFNTETNYWLDRYDGLVKAAIKWHALDDEVRRTEAAFKEASNLHEEAHERLAKKKQPRERKEGEPWWDTYEQEDRQEFEDTQSDMFELMDEYVAAIRHRAEVEGFTPNQRFVHYRTDFFLHERRTPVRNMRMPQLEETIVVGASRLEQGVGVNWCRLKSWTRGDNDRMQIEHQGSRKQFSVTSVLPTEVWETLKQKPAIVVKAWHVLEAIRFETGDPLGRFVVSPDRVMREIKGIYRNHYTPLEKKEATELVDGILQLECHMYWTDHRQEFHRTRGALYLRLLQDETYQDIFKWVPNAIVLQVNTALYDGQGYEFARQFAPYHRAFLQLDAGRDAGAIFLGSYILLKGRPQSSQFEPGEVRIRNETLLKMLTETCVLDTEGLFKKRQMAQIPKKVRGYLEKLKKVGLIRSYSLVGKNDADVTEGTFEELEEMLIDSPELLRSFRERKHVLSFSKEPMKPRRTEFWDWYYATTRIHLSDVAALRQARSRVSAKQKKDSRPKSRSRTSTRVA